MGYIRAKIENKATKMLVDLQPQVEDLLEMELGYRAEVRPLEDLGYVERQLLGIRSIVLNKFNEELEEASFLVYKKNIFLLNYYEILETWTLKSDLVHELGHLFSQKLNPDLDYGNVYKNLFFSSTETMENFNQNVMIAEGFSEYLACILAKDLYNENEKNHSDGRMEALLNSPPITIANNPINANFPFNWDYYVTGFGFFRQMCTFQEDKVEGAKSLVAFPKREALTFFAETIVVEYFS
ncbi:MAG: hypothetical protein ABIF40_03265 [archaeon]